MNRETLQKAREFEAQYVPLYFRRRSPPPFT